MTKTLVLLIGLALAGVAQAQIKCWTTADGKRACGDTPPPGVKVRMVKGAPASSEEAPASAAVAKDGAAKDAKKGPMTPAEREQDYRKRQQESQKVSAKADQELQDQSVKKENCERAREQLRSLEKGGRIARLNSSGERYFLDANQVAQETAKAQESTQKACN